MPYICYVYICC